MPWFIVVDSDIFMNCVSQLWYALQHASGDSLVGGQVTAKIGGLAVHAGLPEFLLANPFYEFKDDTAGATALQVSKVTRIGD